MRLHWLPLVLFVSGAPAQAQPAGPAREAVEPGAGVAPTDPFVSVRDADPLELARLVARLGDGAVLDRLESADRASAEVTLAALHAAPRLRAPEAALGPLAVIALGVDPDLAPAAMLSLHTIVEALDASALAARETSLADLTLAMNALESLAEDESARADLRVAAALCLTRVRSFADVPPSTAD